MGCSLRLAALLSFAPIAIMGCGDDDGTTTTPPSPDAGDATVAIDAPPGVCDGGVAALEDPSAEGHASPLGASATEARAGRIDEAAELPPDPDGVSTARLGDYLLANDRIAVIIEAARPSDDLDPWGGDVIAVSRVRDRALLAPSPVETFLLVGRFTLNARAVGVLEDGSGGGRAVVRAIGTLSAMPKLAEAVRALSPGDYSGFEVAIDYALEPGADHIDVTMTPRNPQARPFRYDLLYLAQRSTVHLPFTPPTGFAEISGAVTRVAFVSGTTTAYAWMFKEGDDALTIVSGSTGTALFGVAGLVIDACTAAPVPAGRLVVAGPELDDVLGAIARIEGTRTRAIACQVVEADGTTPAAGVRVHAEASSTGAYLTRAVTDAAGIATLHVPETDAVRLTAIRDGDRAAGPVELAASETTGRIQMGATGTVHVVATDVVSGGRLPVRVQVLPVTALAAIPASFGERTLAYGRLYVEFPLDGEATLRVPAESHRVIVSHGYEYEMIDQTVDVAAGTTVEVPAALQRVVATPGVLCGDFHIHTARSNDAPDAPAFKVRAAAGDGVEVIARSDHEFISDFEPVIAELGAGAWTFGMGSLELTTSNWGHFGVFPLELDPAQRNGGAIDWVDIDTATYLMPPVVFASVRARPEAPALVINHPRSVSTSTPFTDSNQAYFSTVGYDPITGTVEHPEMWDEAFTLVEVFNGSNWRHNVDETKVVADWLSFLSAGRRVFAVGSSDSHRVHKGSPVGYPRTCLTLGVDDPTALRALGPNAVRDAALAGHMVVSGGIYIEAVAPGGVGPGGDARGVGARAPIDVTVRAASWIDARTLSVLVDGVIVATIPLDETTLDPLDPVVRFHAPIDVDVAASGSYVIFVAEGDDDLGPVHPRKLPFGVTNPIFLAR